MKRIVCLFIANYFVLLNFVLAQTVHISGKVLNEDNKPLAFTTIRLNDGQQSTYSNEQGEFTFQISSGLPLVKLTLQHVGKQSVSKTIFRKDFSQKHLFILKDLSLTLEEVDINPRVRQTKTSNSSIVFDKETIEASQAFSLQDVLLKLPGKAAVAPDLNKVETLTLRGGTGTLGGSSLYNLNNSLGIAIIMDDIYLSNDANMQSRSVSRWGMTNATLSGVGYSDSYLGTQSAQTYDVAFQGIDLREIPVNNIESIEVVRGVASARYGEITDGAVIINRQAAQSPWAINIQLNGGSTSTSISKGFILPEKWGALNLSSNYTHSNADPRDKIKTFDRYNQSLMWTKRFANGIKNTFSFDHNYRNDGRRADPDDETQQMSVFKNKGISVANRISIPTGSRFFENINANINYSNSDQYSFKQYILNRGITAITVKDTTGIYKGYFSNGSYMAEEEIIGNPINFSARLDASATFVLGAHTHHLSYGVNYNYSNNGGKGVISDPDRPRWVLNGGGNERAYDFEHLPAAQNWGFYVEDQISGTLLQKSYNANIGLRSDIQNGYFTLQPRFSSRLRWNDRWATTASFGISSKAPTLAHMYPAPVFIDIDLLKVYAGDLSKALYLVFTDKKILDNAHLKPSMASQAELGLEYQAKTFSSSLYSYYKHNWNGYETVNQPHWYRLPEFDYSVDNEGNITYTPNGKENTYFDFYGYEMVNGASGSSLGLEWMLNFKPINAIKTSFSLVNNLQYNSYNRTQHVRVKIENNKIILPDGNSMTYAVYNPDDTHYTQIMSKVNSSTHIPKLGFIVNFSADIFWLEKQKASSNIYPVGYYTSEAKYFLINEQPLPQDILNSLKRIASDEAIEGIPHVHTIINMSLAKEINKKFRINLNAYNLFNIRPEYYRITNSGTERIVKYNRRPSFTIGTNIKF